MTEQQIFNKLQEHGIHYLGYDIATKKYHVVGAKVFCRESFYTLESLIKWINDSCVYVGADV
jgi:hypothetical protein